MNSSELRARIEVELEACLQAQRKARATIQLVHDTASQEGRSELTKEEREQVTAEFDRIELHKAAERGIKDRLTDVKHLEAEEADFDRRMSDPESHERTNAASTPAKRTASTSVGRNERTYRPDTDPRGRQFLQDVTRQFLYNDPGAAMRLSAHMQEERVERAQYLERAAGDTTTTNWSGLVVPQYLVDMVAPAVANLRPFADQATNKHALPPNGMSVNISRVTTATSATLQSAELAAVSSTSADDTLLTISVQTAAGSQNISRQAIDRGQGIEDTILQDLFSRYVTDLDNQLINQATTGLAAVANAVTWTQASPTGAGFYGQIQNAASNVEANMLAMGTPSHVVMHSRRWYWLSSQTSTAWPMMNFERPASPSNNAFGYASNTGYAQGPRGVLPNGLEVVVDNNVPTNVNSTQDIVMVVPAREMHLWEDPGAPAFIRAEQPNAASLGVLLVVYGYYAYTFSRYSGAVQKITGTGLAAPSFPS